jgi:general L-amino acid transport system permease protein
MNAINQVAAVRLPPRQPLLVRAQTWTHKHLFPSIGHGLLTVLVLGLLFWLVPKALSWLIFDATFVGTSRTECNPHGACWLPITQR